MMRYRVQIIRESVPPSVAPDEAQKPAGITRARAAYLCGECGIILARDLSPAALLGQSLRCTNCGAVNVSAAACVQGVA